MEAPERTDGMNRRGLVGAGVLSSLLFLGVGSLAAQESQSRNTLTAAERDAGWQLLIDGATT